MYTTPEFNSSEISPNKVRVTDVTDPGATSTPWRTLQCPRRNCQWGLKDL